MAGVFCALYIINSDTTNAVKKSLEAIKGDANHIFIPITVDFDLYHGLHGVQIGLLGFGQWARRAIRTV